MHFNAVSIALVGAISSSCPRNMLAFRTPLSFPQRAKSIPYSSLIRMASTEAEAKTTPEVVPIEDFYEKVSMEDIVSLCKRRGIIFPSSEIYNGFAGFYDYGPLGSELKKNVKDSWWRHFVTRREDVVGLDSSIIHNPTTWKSSGESSNI